MSSDYYSSATLSPEIQARLAAQQEREAAERKRQEEERQRKLAIDASRARDELAQRLLADIERWKQGQLAGCADAEVLAGQSREERERARDRSPRDIAEHIELVAEKLTRVPPEVHGAFRHEIARIREVVTGIVRDDPAQATQLTWAELTVDFILKKAPAVLKQQRALRDDVQRLLVRAHVIDDAAPRAMVIEAEAIRGSLHALDEEDDPQSARRSITDLERRLGVLEQEHQTTKERMAVRSYIVDSVSEALREMGYEPIPLELPPDASAAVRTLFMTPDDNVVEAKFGLGGEAKFEFKANPARRGDIMDEAYTWCGDLDLLKTVLARRGVRLRDHQRYEPSQRPITTAILPTEIMARFRERKKKRRDKPKAKEREV